ncbi:MAG: hypothetical protein R3236_07975, partial [Phycisphaeraceae bacterium]|nr:hypothetical protein [Phycisphaeraceae bacterium]
MRPLTVRTLLCFLVGDAEAIRRVASSRHAVGCGAILLLSAGFAREYDQEYLLAEPWYLLIPMIASTFVATVLFMAVWFGLGWRGGRERIDERYRAFLSCFWMTAPLAWLYAIPVERFLTPVDAVVANAWLLGIVAGWRVILILRVITVLFDMKWAPVASLVLWICDTIVIAALVSVPRPLVSIMGGIVHTPEDRLVSHLTGTICLFAVMAWPVLLIAAA